MSKTKNHDVFDDPFVVINILITLLLWVLFDWRVAVTYFLSIGIVVNIVKLIKGKPLWPGR